MKNGKVLLAAVAAGGVGLLLLSGKKAHAAEPEGEAVMPPVLPPVQPTPPRTTIRLPEDIVPPRIEIEDDDEEEDDTPRPQPPRIPPDEDYRPTPPGQGAAPRPPVVIDIPRPPTAAEEDAEAEEDTPIVRIPSPPQIVVRPPPLPAPPQASPPVAEEEEETVIPDDTEQVLRILLAREGTSDWKRAEPILKTWQRNRGLVADGKFGRLAALKMAEETGLVPIVRFWPQGTYPESGIVGDYQAALYDKASRAEEPRASQLRAAAEREQGQGFKRNPGPVSPTISI